MKNYAKKKSLFSHLLRTTLCMVFFSLMGSSFAAQVTSAPRTVPFKLGIENISADFIKQFKGKRIGLITNQTGIDQLGRSTITLLQSKGLSIAYLFAPEHGVDGKAGAGEKVTNSIDKETGISIVSLYGHGTGKMIPEPILKKVDVIMFDIQDSGMRHYTYISTLLHAMRVAQQYDKKFVVFDRPNPLGAVMEGSLVDKKLISFISVAPIPVRHGMTVGELARYFNAHELKTPISLDVVKMHNYNRNTVYFPDTLRAPLSPGLRLLPACYGYSFLGLLGEVAPFGIGLHTEARYQCITLPKKMGVKRKVWARLQQMLKQSGLDTVFFEYQNPKTTKQFSGLRLSIKDINKVYAFESFYIILNFFNKEGIPLSFSREFNLAIGTPLVRDVVQGKQNPAVLIEQVNSQLTGFFDKARSSYMYTSLPVLHFMK